MSGERVAVFTVCVWQEDESGSDLRARVTWVTDVERPAEVTVAAAGREAILTLMRLWLDELTAERPGHTA
jgi:hypothetical protein